MKDKFKVYILCWVIICALFNSVAMAFQEEVPDYRKYDMAFKLGMIFINATFVLQLGATYFAYKRDQEHKSCGDLSLVTLSFLCCVGLFIFGSIAMGVEMVPWWAGLAVNCLILIGMVVATIRAEDLPPMQTEEDVARHEEMQKAIAKKTRRVTVAVVIVAAAVTAALLVLEFIVPYLQYDKAEKIYNSGDIQGGYDAFKQLKIKDSEARANQIWRDDPTVVKVGDHLVFGSYEQDADKTNGKEPVEWRVLAVEENSILIISEYCLDCNSMTLEYENCTWETSFMRQWMNTEMKNDLFNEEEQKIIVPSFVKAEPNPLNPPDPGNDTVDDLFLLNIQEAWQYFAEDKDRQCVATDHCNQRGGWAGQEYILWWLRSPGFTERRCAFVHLLGTVNEYGLQVPLDYYGVRPALRLGKTTK